MPIHVMTYRINTTRVSERLSCSSLIQYVYLSPSFTFSLPRPHIKHREVIACMHKRGINFSLPPCRGGAGKEKYNNPLRVHSSVAQAFTYVFHARANLERGGTVIEDCSQGEEKTRRGSLKKRMAMQLREIPTPASPRRLIPLPIKFHRSIL